MTAFGCKIESLLGVSFACLPLKIVLGIYFIFYHGLLFQIAYLKIAHCFEDAVVVDIEIQNC